METIKYKLKIIIFLLLAGGIADGICSYSSLWGEMIVDIRVEGTERVAESVVTSISGLEIGKELKAPAIRDAVKQLVESKLFEDVKIERNEIERGIEVIIEVKEWPIISKISFEGKN